METVYANTNTIVIHVHAFKNFHYKSSAIMQQTIAHKITMVYSHYNKLFQFQV